MQPKIPGALMTSVAFHAVAYLSARVLPFTESSSTVSKLLLFTKPPEAVVMIFKNWVG